MDKKENSPPDAKVSHNLCFCYVKLYSQPYLNTVCLIDMIFYLLTLTFNLTWLIIDIAGGTKTIGTQNNLTFHLFFGIIMFGNAIILAYAIHFKLHWRQYNSQVKNGYFKGYFYFRSIWALLSVLVCLILLIYLLTRNTTTNPEEFNKFRRISNLFSILYVLYSAFIISSSSEFKNAWYSLLSKDIDFYYS